MSDKLKTEFLTLLVDKLHATPGFAIAVTANLDGAVGSTVDYIVGACADILMCKLTGYTIDMRAPDKRTVHELLLEAYQAQDACNLLAVLNAAARALRRLRDMSPAERYVPLLGPEWPPRRRSTQAYSTASKACHPDKHPVMVLWADKIAHLTDTQTIGTQRVMEAFDLASLALPACDRCGKKHARVAQSVLARCSDCTEG